MSIGKNIKRLRESHDLTQAELGKIAGVTDKAVSTWENGSADPRMGAVQKMADYFGIKKSDILDDDPSSSAPAPEADLSADEQQLVDTYRELNEIGKREARKRVGELTEIERYIKIRTDQSAEA